MVDMQKVLMNECIIFFFLPHPIESDNRMMESVILYWLKQCISHITALIYPQLNQRKYDRQNICSSIDY